MTNYFRPLLVMLLLSMLIPARGANPAYGDFNANQFAVNGNKVRLKSGMIATNIVIGSGTITGNGEGLTNLGVGGNIYTTNIFTTNIYTTFLRGKFVISSNVYATNIITTNLYSSNIFTTNLFATNIYSTNLFSTFNITSNLFATNIITTNLYVSNVYVTNLIGGTLAGNGSGISNAAVLIAGANVIITTNTPGKVWTITSTGGVIVYTNNATGTPGTVTGLGISTNLNGIALLAATTNNFTGNLGVNGTFGTATATAGSLDVAGTIHGVHTNGLAAWDANGFLSVDSGGLAVWTNNAGTIRPVESVASTNILLFPTATASSTPYKFGTSVGHTSGNLLEIANSTNLMFAIKTNGALRLGRTSMSDVAYQNAISSTFDFSLGDLDQMNVYFAARSDPAFTTYGEFNLTLTELGSSSFFMDTKDVSGRTGYSEFSGDAATPHILIDDENGHVLTLSPRTDAGTTPYVFNTSSNHTSGNLFELKNNGTNLTQIDSYGAVKVGRGITATFDTVYNIFVGGHNTSLGEPTPAQLLLFSVDNDGATTNKATLTWFGDSSSGPYSFFELLAKDVFNGTSHSLTFEAQNGEADFQLTENNSAITRLFPTANASTTAYTFGTTVTHTSGNLAEVKNNGSVKFAVDYSGVVTANNIITPTNTPVVGQVLHATSTGGATKWDYVNQVGTNVATGSNANFNLPYSRFTIATTFLWTSPANVDTTLKKLQVTDVAVTNSTTAAVLATFNGTVRVTGTPYVTNVTYFHWRVDPWMTNCLCEPVF